MNFVFCDHVFTFCKTYFVYTDVAVYTVHDVETVFFFINCKSELSKI